MCCNRRALRTRSADLEQQSALTSQSVAVLAVDLDHFKAVNDTAATTWATWCSRRSRTVGCACVPEGASPGASAARSSPWCCRAPRGPMRSPWRRTYVEAVRGQPIAGASITVSIGVAASAEGAPFLYETVFREADAALYRAKSEGRDRVCTIAPGLRAPAAV